MNDFKKEIWKDIIFDDKIAETEKFQISNYGRVKNCRDDQNCFIIKPAFINGYQTVSLKQKSGKFTSRYVHKLVAQHFIPKENELKRFVIHLDYDKTNNKLINLDWATTFEKEQHQFSNPNRNIRPYSKLNEGHVKIIKRMLKNNNNRLKRIAKQFGVSDMQIHRIKTGENWGHVTLD